VEVDWEGLVDIPKKRAPWWSASGTTLSADGTPLAFASGGPKGARALICCNGVGVSTFFWDYVGHFFSKTHQVVVWDYKGHGASGEPPSRAPITMASIADDCARVLDANGIDRAVLLGHSMGCQVILEFAHLFPKRTVGLVPMLGAFGHPADTFLDPRIGRSLYKVAYGIGTAIPDLLGVASRMVLRKPIAWQFARLTGLVHPDLCRREDMEPYLEHLARQNVGVFFQTARAAVEHDAGPFLGEIRAPALVVAGERDLFTPRHLSIEMASRLQNAELLEIPRGSHAALIEQPELINLRLEKFLRERVAAYEATLGRDQAPTERAAPAA
jgi:pimeloyl-ACP methyl ester carboxylesterase